MGAADAGERRRQPLIVSANRGIYGASGGFRTMFLRFRRVAVAAVMLMASGGAAPAKAPRLPASIAGGANPLQRAAWACEAAAPVLAPASPLNSAPTVRRRYFLSGAGEAGTNEPPLVLSSGKLTGLGWLSDDRGWAVIRFSCALTPDLRRATKFGFSTIAEAAAANGEPTAADAPAQSNGKLRTWQVQPSRAILDHSVDETDDRDFRADCVPHGGRATVVLSQTVPWLKKDGFVVVTLGDGTRSGLYVAKASFSEQGAAFVPELTVAANDPLFTWMATGQRLLINVGRDVAYSVPLTGAAEPVKAFAEVCRS